MKNALILHGTSGSSKGNWFPWIKGKLEEKGWIVWIPDLPGAEKPNIERYSEFILENKDWEFNEDSWIIGHSSGAVATLGLLQNLPENVVINMAVLVGSFKDNLGREDLSDLFIKPFDFEKIKKHAKKFILIHSDNDPYCPLDHAKYLAKKLQGELLIKEGQEHFSYSAGGPKYKKFPSLLELID